MSMQQLSEQVSVSGQLSVGDLPGLKELGVELLVCNRPDGESADQPPYAEIAAAAQELGMKVENIPFAGPEMTEAHGREFAALLTSGKRTHAYCRSGARSGNLFALACQMTDR